MAVMQPIEASTKPPATDTVEGLFAALESPLLNYARRLVGDSGAAEDLVQEAFMRLHTHFDQVHEPRRWLYRSVHNLALNHRRRANKTVLLDFSANEGSPVSADNTDAQPLPDEQIARWETIGRVRLSLELLDERSRELIRLKFNEELSYKEISARTGLKVGHVGYLLHHALKDIADELTEEGTAP